MSLNPSYLLQILIKIGQSPITSILVVVGLMRFMTKGIESALKFLGQAFEDYVAFLIRCETAKVRLKRALGRLRRPGSIRGRRRRKRDEADASTRGHLLMYDLNSPESKSDKTGNGNMAAVNAEGSRGQSGGCGPSLYDRGL